MWIGLGQFGELIDAALVTQPITSVPTAQERHKLFTVIKGAANSGRRLAPGAWEELKRLTPRHPVGDYRNKLFQRLTEDVGHPELREHLAAVLMLMKYSPNWQVFMDRLDKKFPQWGSNYTLPFPGDCKPPETGEAAN